MNGDINLFNESTNQLIQPINQSLHKTCKAIFYISGLHKGNRIVSFAAVYQIIKHAYMRTSFLFIVVGLLLSSCTKESIRGSGTEVTEDRAVNNFSRVETAGSHLVFISQGAAFKVEVKGYENLVPYFETTVNNGRLLLGFKENVSVTNNNIQVLITMPLVEGLSLAGSGAMVASGTFPTITNMSIDIAGSGDIAIENGSAANLTTNISGSGNIKAFGFVAVAANSTISGSGNTELTATSTLNGKITGSGNIYYKGTPAVTSQITGSGAIVKK